MDLRSGTSLGKAKERVDELLWGLRTPLWLWPTLLVLWSSLLVRAFAEKTEVMGLGKLDHAGPGTRRVAASVRDEPRGLGDQKACCGFFAFEFEYDDTQRRRLSLDCRLTMRGLPLRQRTKFQIWRTPVVGT